MSNSKFLDIQYNISKRKYLRKPSHLFSFKDRQNSGLATVYQPNSDEMKKVFNKFDSNKDGKISRSEYKAILKALGKGSFAREVEKIFEVADLNGDGFIDFQEFLQVHEKGGGVKRSDINRAFQMFDVDRDGKISVEEVFELLKKLGERCSLQDCRRMVSAVDTNGDGFIDFDDFMTMMNRSQSA